MPNLMLFDCMRSAEKVLVDGLPADIQELEDGSVLCCAGPANQNCVWRFEDQEVTLGGDEDGVAAAVADCGPSGDRGEVVLVAFQKQGPLQAKDVKRTRI